MLCVIWLRFTFFLFHPVSPVFYSSFLLSFPPIFISSFFQLVFHFLAPFSFWYIFFSLLHSRRLSTFVPFFLLAFLSFVVRLIFSAFFLNISPVLLTDSSKPWWYRKHNFSTVTRSQFTNVRTCLPTFPEAEYNSAASYNCFFSVLDIKIITTNLLILTVCYSDTNEIRTSEVETVIRAD